MSNGNTIARHAVNSSLHNVLNTRVVEVYFHRSPGKDSNGDRAIAKLDYQVRAQGFVIQRGTTGADGKIEVSVRGAYSTLLLLYNGVVVAEYEVNASTAALDPVANIQGQKQRLRLLGYQIGHGGAHRNGVDNVNNLQFERSVLDFQVDSGFLSDAIVTAAVQRRLTNEANSI
jgi:hypothetical protein